MNNDTDTPIEPIDTTHDAGEPAHAAPEGTPAGDTPPGSPPSSEATMEAAATRIRELEAELAAMRDKWVRSEAEMQNLRTRTKRDVEDARQYAVQKFARDVVEAAENLKRGITSLPAQAEAEDSLVTKLRDGFHSIDRSFVGILERHGIVGHDPAGQPFDANLHQAMAEAPSDAHAPGTVMQAWTPAWTLNGRLLKPAMVVVANADSKPGAEAPKAEAPATDATTGNAT